MIDTDLRREFTENAKRHDTLMIRMLSENRRLWEENSLVLDVIKELSEAVLALANSSDTDLHKSRKDTFSKAVAVVGERLLISLRNLAAKHLKEK